MYMYVFISDLTYFETGGAVGDVVLMR